MEDLFLLATNRFADCDAHDRLSIKHYQEAFDLLYGQVSWNTRQITGRILAFCAQTPRAITLQLALEDPAIAKPVLIHSSVLGQLDLLQIVEARGVRHAALIARRPDIGPSLLGRLKTFKDPEITAALDANEALIDGRAAKDPQDIFQTIGQDAEPPVSEGSSEMVRSSSAQTRLLEAAARRGLDIDAAALSPAASADETFDGPIGDTLESLAAAKDRQGLALAMRQYDGLSLTTAFQVLEQHSGDSMAVFLKAHEVEEAQTNRILMLIFPAIGLSVHNAMGMVKFYRELQTESCKDAVAQWPREAAAARHQPVYEETGSQRGSRTDRSVGEPMRDQETFKEAV